MNREHKIKAVEGMILKSQISRASLSDYLSAFPILGEGKHCNDIRELVTVIVDSIEIDKDKTEELIRENAPVYMKDYISKSPAHEHGIQKILKAITTDIIKFKEHKKEYLTPYLIKEMKKEGTPLNYYMNKFKDSL